MTNLIKTNQESEVLAIFTKKNGFQPYLFKWAGETFKVEKVNLIHEKKIGNDKLIYFSVLSQNNYFKLAFNTNLLKWFIEEVYHE